MRNLLTSVHGLIGVLCLALCGMFLAILFLPARSYPVPELGPGEYEPLAIDFGSVAAPDPSHAVTIAARLLFSPERKRVEFPPEPILEPEPEIAAPPPPPEPPEIALVGIIRDGANEIAMIRRADAPTAVALRRGAEIDGWEVSVIEADSITIKMQSATHEVRLPSNGR